MKKLLLFALLILTMSVDVLAISDKLYYECLKQQDYSSAESVMTSNWRKLKSILSKSDFKYVLEDQRRWVKNGREKEISYIKSDYPNMNICSLYAVSSYARATVLGEIAKFLENYPNYTQKDINLFINNLDYVRILYINAQRLNEGLPPSFNHTSSNETSSKGDIGDILIDKAKEAAIEKALDVGVRWLLKKLIK